MNGMAIAVGRERITDTIAHFTPLWDALGLLKEIPSTARMSELDGKIRSKQIDQFGLSRQLRPGLTVTSARNVELVSWAASVSTRSEQYRDAKDLFDCPIVYAFWHRTLDAAADLLKPVMNADLRAKTDLMLAQTASALGRNAVADARLTAFAQAITYFDHSPSAQDPPASASGPCDPAAFLALDPQSSFKDERSAVAFLLSATKGQYEEAKRKASGAFNFGGVNLGLSYNNAKALAFREASARRFLFSRSAYADYLGQSLSGDAAQLYSNCLAVEAQTSNDFRIWPAERAGDYHILNAQWSGDLDQPKADLEDQLTDNLKVIDLPKTWTRAVTQKLIVSKIDRSAPSFIKLTVGGRVAGYSILGDSASVEMKTAEVLGETRTISVGGGRGLRCTTHVVETCIFPQRSGGFLMPGTGRWNSVGASSERAAFRITVDTPERICGQISVTPAACEMVETAQGRLSAVERFGQ